ncbi:hypothetical protein [Sedimentitalea nanhaiensis]|uniref:Type IV pilus biogenesis n=1 Tax=Sedimentitalea nanhaiensis TaxID=999627 RepID=A0A1I7D0G6_9RHOB|nr:hypothetical protein [Sedimentitalea nanhaiensis]SFU05169.1 hypothetical protein SAMN05216236_12160 [Sedimentitalea nanhaiensis]
MTNATEAGPTPSNVAKLATQNRVLNSRSTDLIGLFGPQSNLTALVRESNGRIRKVETGDKLSIGRIVGIDEDGVVVERNGSTRRLALPSG